MDPNKSAIWDTCWPFMEWYGDGGIHLWLIDKIQRENQAPQGSTPFPTTAGLSELMMLMIPVVCTCHKENFNLKPWKNSWLLQWKGSLALDHWNQMNPQVSRGTPSHFGLHFKHHLRCDDLTRKYCYGHCSNCSKRSGPIDVFITSFYIYISILHLYISIPTAFVFHRHHWPTASSRRAVWTCRVKARL
jgi:hypothetical protein